MPMLWAPGERWHVGFAAGSAVLGVRAPHIVDPLGHRAWHTPTLASLGCSACYPSPCLTPQWHSLSGLSRRNWEHAVLMKWHEGDVWEVRCAAAAPCVLCQRACSCCMQGGRRLPVMVT